MNPPLTAKEWAWLVIYSRRYPNIYVPSASRDGLTDGVVDFSCRPFGRSKNKFKAYAHYSGTGEVVRTLVLLDKYLTEHI